MPYNYNFRTLAESDNCLSTFQFITEKEAFDKLRWLHANGYDAHVHQIKHNDKPGRADYEYRLFDLVQLPGEVGMVLCLGVDVEPEFHGFRPDIDQALAYVDEYWYHKNKENE